MPPEASAIPALKRASTAKITVAETLPPPTRQDKSERKQRSSNKNWNEWLSRDSAADVPQIEVLKRR